MNYKKASRYWVLGILFFLPVAFLLILYPATHHYTPLEIVQQSVIELKGFKNSNHPPVQLKNKITVLGFAGNTPRDYETVASNLKALIYDKFKGFKGFQVLIVAPKGSETSIHALEKAIRSYDDLKFWHFTFGTPKTIRKLYRSLNTRTALSHHLSTPSVFIIDKDQHQRGRLDDRDTPASEQNKTPEPLLGYDCIKISEIKHKMSDDLRILFTEYRQKRKGKFQSETRRTKNLNE